MAPTARSAIQLIKSEGARCQFLCCVLVLGTRNTPGGSGFLGWDKSRHFLESRPLKFLVESLTVDIIYTASCG